MDCKQAQGLVTAFINDQITDDDELQAFLEHVEGCKECKEELEVTYSLVTAMKQLDAGEDLSDNFIGDLNDKIAECYLEAYRKRRMAKRRRILLAVLILLLLLLNGITAVEKREEADRRFLREVIGVEVP